jgi:Transposase IS66 family
MWSIMAGVGSRGTWREAPLDVSTQVIGHGRMGVRLTSVMAYLRTVMRLPVRQIQAYLATLHGLKISSGEIVELLHRAKAHLEPRLSALKQEIRASPAVQADAHRVARRWQERLHLECEYACSALLRVPSLDVPVRS